MAVLLCVVYCAALIALLSLGVKALRRERAANGKSPQAKSITRALVVIAAALVVVMLLALTLPPGWVLVLLGIALAVLCVTHLLSMYDLPEHPLFDKAHEWLWAVEDPPSSDDDEDDQKPKKSKAIIIQKVAIVAFVAVLAIGFFEAAYDWVTQPSVPSASPESTTQPTTNPTDSPSSTPSASPSTSSSSSTWAPCDGLPSEMKQVKAGEKMLLRAGTHERCSGTSWSDWTIEEPVTVPVLRAGEDTVNCVYEVRLTGGETAVLRTTKRAACFKR